MFPQYAEQVKFGRTLKQIAVLSLLITCSVCAASEYVEFTVVERIRFSVPGNWPVIASKSTSEKTVFAFQIPNPADKGTTDSSNLSIVASDLKDARDRDAFEKKASPVEHDAQEKALVPGWRCATFSGMQKSTRYVVWDCYRIVADCGVSVRIAWPHLSKNPPDYDEQMEAVLADLLMSVSPSKKVPTQQPK